MAGGVARTVTVTGFANFAQIEAAFARMGLVADESTKTMQGAAAKAGESAAAMAKAAGLSADQQTAAAGRAAAAQVEASAQITRAQKAAADAAMATAKAMGLSADEQDLAAKRAIAAQADVEAKMGASTSRLTALGRSLGTWGVPFGASIQTMGERIDQTTTKTGRFAESLASLGKLTLIGGLAGFAAAAYEGVKGAVALQKQMEMIHTQAGASQAEVQKMTQAVLNLGPSVGTGPQALAEGLYHVESVGLRGAKALNVLRTAAEGAKVGNANLTDVTNGLDSAVVSGIKGVQNYQEAMGALNATVGSGDMTMQNLAEALGTGLLATMKTFGVSLRDTGAALAVFGDNNIRGAEAATKLASAVRIMAAPSAAGAKALAAVNISQMQLANDMRSGGLIKALEDLKTHLVESGATASQQAAIVTDAFGRRQSTGVLVLLDELERLRTKYQAVGDGASKFGTSWSATQKTLSFQFDQLKASLQSLADRLGTVLIPVIQSLINWVSNAVTWFEKHKAVAEALAGVIGGVLSVAIATFVVGKLASLIKSVGTALGAFVKLADWLTGGMITAFRASGAEADASIAQIGTTTTATAATVKTESAAMSGSLATAGVGAATADAEIVGIGTAATTTAGVVETETVAMGASFTAMLGPIALVVAAIARLPQAISNVQGQINNFGKGITNGAGGAVGIGGRQYPGGMSKPAFDAYAKAHGVSNLQIPFDWSIYHGSQAGQSTANVGSTNRTAGFGGASAFTSSSNWAKALLGALGVNVTPGSVTALEDFQAHEGPFGTQAAYNPLNVSGPMVGTGKFDGTPAENYGSPAAGLQGEVAYFQRYGPSVIAALRTGNVAAVEAAVRSLGPNAFGNDTATPWAGSATSVQAPSHPSAAVQQYFAGKTAPSAASQNVASSIQNFIATLQQTITKFQTEAHTAHALGNEPLVVSADKMAKAAEGLLAMFKSRSHGVTTAAALAGIEDPIKTQLAALTAAFAGHKQILSYQSGLESKGTTDLSRFQNLATQGSVQSIRRATTPAATGEFDKLVSQLRATHATELEKLAGELLAAHKQALETLRSEVVARQDQARGQILQKQATELKDQTTAIQTYGQDELQVTTATYQRINNAATAAYTKLQDAGQTMQDQFAGIVTAITDATQGMADTSQQIVDGIQDQTAIKVDLLGERGLYGLNLLAQQQKVAGDQAKAYYDQAIDADQLNLDVLQGQWDAQIATAQAALDNVKATQDARVAIVQQQSDTVTLSGDTKIAAAQAHADSVISAEDIRVQVAQSAVDLAAGLTGAAQKATTATLTLVTGTADKSIAAANRSVTQVTTTVGAQIAAANQSLTTAQNSANTAIQTATNTLIGLQGQANVQLAGATQTLTSLKGTAAATEATLQGTQSITQEMASVQFAGSGLSVNITGVPLTDAAAIASAVGWELRTRVPV